MDRYHQSRSVGCASLFARLGSVIALLYPLAFFGPAAVAQNTAGAQTNTVSVGDRVLIDSSKYESLSDACSAAATAHAGLYVSKAWKGLATQTCSAPLEFPVSDAVVPIQPAKDQTVTLNSGIVFAGLGQICDTSAGGHCIIKNVTEIYPQWFGAKNDGVADATRATNEAVHSAYASDSNAIIRFPAGRYLITATIGLHAGAKIKGANLDYGGIAGASSFANQLSDSRGTVIIFAPSTKQSLFVAVPPLGGSTAYSGIAISGLNIWGNSTPDAYHRSRLGITSDVTTSLYAIDFQGVQFSNVDHVAIAGFVAGIAEGSRSQENTFDHVNIERCRTAVRYTSNTVNVEPTSSVWTDCVFRTAQYAVEAQDTGDHPWNGDSLQIRFEHCYFEDIADYGLVLPPGAQEWYFEGDYAEAIGEDASVPDRSMFYIGHGASLSKGYHLNSLTVVAGQYAGSDTGTLQSTFLNVDRSDGVNLIAVDAKRFLVGISATGNTRANSIYLSNAIFDDVGTLFKNTRGILFGQYRTVDMTAGSNVVTVETPYISSDSDLQILAPTVSLGDGSTSVQPGANGTETLGSTSKYWAATYTDGVSFPAKQTPSADANTLDDYREYTAASTACTGAITTSVSWKVTKIGNHVTLTLPPVSGVASPAPYFQFGVSLPSAFRPSASLAFPVLLEDNSANLAMPGMVVIDAVTGNIKVYKDGTGRTNFSAGVKAGLGQGAGVSVSWTI